MLFWDFLRFVIKELQFPPAALDLSHKKAMRTWSVFHASFSCSRNSVVWPSETWSRGRGSTVTCSWSWERRVWFRRPSGTTSRVRTSQRPPSGTWVVRSTWRSDGRERSRGWLSEGRKAETGSVKGDNWGRREGGRWGARETIHTHKLCFCDLNFTD